VILREDYIKKALKKTAYGLFLFLMIKIPNKPAAAPNNQE
jgi:hypothetical protein